MAKIKTTIAFGLMLVGLGLCLKNSGDRKYEAGDYRGAFADYSGSTDIEEVRKSAWEIIAVHSQTLVGALLQTITGRYPLKIGQG